MKIIVWNSQEKRVADYYTLIRGCDVLCLLSCGQWEIPQEALRVQSNLYHWKEEGNSIWYDVIYCPEGLAFICREGLYSGNSILYSVHASIGALAGICVQDNFWLFVNHESNTTNAYHIGEFYLREISDRFKKAAFAADFKDKVYFWTQETMGQLYCATLPQDYHSLTINYLFTIHVACKDLYVIAGYEDAPNQPTFFDLEI